MEKQIIMFGQLDLISIEMNIMKLKIQKKFFLILVFYRNDLIKIISLNMFLTQMEQLLQQT